MDYLAAQWRQTWHRLGAGPPENAYDEVIAAYGQPHRHYHDITHIANSLELLDWHRSEACNPDQLELAIWLHDVVYDPRASDNEARSADYSELCLVRAGLTRHVAPVRALIEATAHGCSRLRDDQALLSDIDLAILGSRGDIYAEYALFVRAEYKWVPMSMYREKRAAVLAGFLERPFIYHSPSFALYETRARENLTDEIAQLLG